MTRVFYSFPHVLGRPGIGTTAWYQVQGLINAGAVVHVVTSACERNVDGAASLVETMKLAGIQIPRRIFGADRAWHLHDRLAVRHLRRLAGHVDVVHCWPSGALETLQAARNLGLTSFLERPSAHTNYVLDAVRVECRRLGIKQPRDHYSATSASRLEREKKEWNAADYLLCPSEFVGATFRQYGFGADRLLYHQYGFDPQIFFPGTRANRSGITTLYCGEGIPLKGLHIALEAWCCSAAASQGRFLIAGQLMPALEPAIRHRLEHPGVRLLGFQANVAELMRQSEILVLPSMAEGSALVTYEARACGCVALVSDAAGAKCDHMVTGFVHTAGDGKALTDQFNTLAEHPTLLAALRNNSLAEINRWTWRNAAEKLDQLYCEHRGHVSATRSPDWLGAHRQR